MDPRFAKSPSVLLAALAIASCRSETPPPSDSGGTGTGSDSGSGTGSGADGSTGGGSTGGAFSLNDVHINLISAPDELKKRPLTIMFGWKGCPVADCATAEVLINGESIGKVSDLGSTGVAMAPAIEASIVAKLRPNQDHVLKLSVAGQSTELTMRCPKRPELTAPTGPIASRPVQVAWSPLDGVAANSGDTLAESSCSVAVLSFGPVVGLGLLSSKQVKATDTTVTMTVPPKTDAPLADSLVLSISAAGTVARTPQGGEGSCNQTIYSKFDWK